MRLRSEVVAGEYCTVGVVIGVDCGGEGGGCAGREFGCTGGAEWWTSDMGGALGKVGNDGG